MGNDTYAIEDARDVIIENGSAGTDTVQTYINYTLVSNVEDLTLGGTAKWDKSQFTDGTLLTCNNS